MHSYSTNFNHSAQIYVLLAFLSLCIYGGLSQLPIPFIHITPLVTMTIFGVAVFLFEHSAWRVLCFIKPLHVDNFSGVYSGVVHAGDGSTYKATYRIKQTWSRISISFESGGASSKSFAAATIKSRLSEDEVELIYSYFTQAKKEAGLTVLPAHYGTAMLKLDADGTQMIGDYFTEQDRNTSGAVTVSRDKKRNVGVLAIAIASALVIFAVIGAYVFVAQLQAPAPAI